MCRKPFEAFAAIPGDACTAVTAFPPFYRFTPLLAIWARALREACGVHRAVHINCAHTVNDDSLPTAYLKDVAP